MQMFAWLRHLENVFLQVQEGVVDASVLQSYGWVDQRQFSSTGFAPWWSDHRGRFNDDFLAAFEMGLRPIEPTGWQDMLELFDVDPDELREWLRYAAPFVKQGDLRTGEGWEFSIAHVIRWLALFGAALERLGVVADPTRPGKATRRLRHGRAQ